MSLPPRIPRKQSDPSRRDEETQDTSAVERLIQERTKELQTECEALRREIAQLKQSEIEGKQDDQDLRKSEEKYRLLVENTLDVMYSVTQQGIVTYVSPQVTRFGYRPEEVISRPFLDFITPEFRKHVLEMFQAAIESGQVFPTEFQVQGKDGLHYWVEAFGKTLFDAAGQPVLQVGVMRDVTERKRAEEILRESEEKARMLIQSSRDGIILNDEEGAIIEWNQGMERITGIPKEEMLGHTLLQIAHRLLPDGERIEDMEQRVVAMIAELNQPAPEPSEIPYIEVAIQRPDGSPRFVQVQSFTFTSSGRILYGGVIRDITEQKQAEEALKEREEQLRNLIESSGDGIILTDEAGRITTWNTGMETITGLAARDVLGVPAWEIQSRIVDAEWAGPDHRTRYRTVWDRVLRDGSYQYRNRLLDVQARTPHGEVRYLQQSVFTIPTRRGYRVGCIMRDITKRRQEERYKEELLQRIEAERSILRSVLEQMPEGVMIAEAPSGKVLLDNKQLLKICRMPVEIEIDVAESPSWSAYGYHSDGRPYSVEEWPMFRALHQGEVIVDEEVKIRRGDGTWGYISVRAAPVRDETGTIQSAVVLTTDITERKEAEELLEERSENLKRSNEDLERFAYVSSHDLQEPLRAIVSYTQLLERRYKDQLDRDADEYLHYIVDGGKRMQALIQDLLEFSRVTTKGHEFSRTDSEAVLNATLANLQVRMEQCQATIAHDPLPMVMADASQLQQVFQNLIGNAIKFQKKDVPAKIHVSAKEQDGMVQFSVQDNGIGIDKEYFQKIFVVFQRLHKRDQYEGTGIGLALCKRIIERHGGQIWVESEPGEGSTFYFTVPAVKSQS